MTLSSRARVWLLYLGLYLLITLLFARVSETPDIRIAHGVLAYLVLIIGASRQGGPALSLVMVVLGYLGVDWFFVPPHFALGSLEHLNWLIILGFVLTGILVSALFTQLQRAVAIARERTLEVERLSEERLQLEREVSTVRVLNEADRLKGALLGSIAHDLRSPIATLALVADPAAGFAPEQALARVAKESLRLGEFISTLQRFADGSSGGGLKLAEQEVEDLLQTTRRSLESLLRDRRVLLPADAARYRVRCDLTLTVQILGNLLQNAARYSPAEAPIEVRVEADDSSVRLVVADRGPGLGDMDLERLFTPLRRPPSPTSEDATEDTRMGMGLSIARTFARAQRGDVTYQPRAGGGSEFTLRLPRATSPAT